MKIDLKELGKRIKLTRQGQDLTQEMLAEKAGVSQHYIYEIEAGRKAMSIHSFASLTTALDVSADYLFVCDLSKCPRYDPACVQGLIISMSIQAF